MTSGTLSADSKPVYIHILVLLLQVGRPADGQAVHTHISSTSTDMVTRGTLSADVQAVHTHMYIGSTSTDRVSSGTHISRRSDCTHTYIM